MGVTLDGATGELSGEGVVETARTVADLAGVYRDEAARAALPQTRTVYRVQSWEPKPEGEPGAVGDEYFMTRGHFHANQDRPELEVTVRGEGALVMMTPDRQTRIERMAPGSVHHVPPGTAHRVANTGVEPLVFVSYWASETGHDYTTIRERGFSAHVRRVDGRPALVPDGAGG